MVKCSGMKEAVRPPATDDDAAAKEAVVELFRTYGLGLTRDLRNLDNMLRDTLADVQGVTNRAYRNLIMAVAADGIPAAMEKLTDEGLRAIELPQIAQRFACERALDPQRAHWAIATYALAIYGIEWSAATATAVDAPARANSAPNVPQATAATSPANHVVWRIFAVCIALGCFFVLAFAWLAYLGYAEECTQASSLADATSCYTTPWWLWLMTVVLTVGGYRLTKRLWRKG